MLEEKRTEIWAEEVIKGCWKKEGRGRGERDRGRRGHWSWKERRGQR